MAIAQPSLTNVVLAIGGVTWPTTARLVRAEFRGLRGRDFVTAAQGLGYGHVRIMLVEILPNACRRSSSAPPCLVATAILMESALSFLGLSDPNVVSWGSMIGAGRRCCGLPGSSGGCPASRSSRRCWRLYTLGDALKRRDSQSPPLSGNRRA